MNNSDSQSLSLQASIYVAGHRGMVGSAIVRKLQDAGYDNIITRSSAELDLTDQHAVREFFQSQNIEYVVLAAAKVGGIHANNTYPAEFIYKNMMIEANVIHEAYMADINRLLFLGSSCIYPKHCPQPMKEEYLLTGILEPTNEPYALAKIAGIKLCESYNRQYGSKYRSVMPTNLYGPNDNFDLENSHVLPALIRKFHEAKVNDEAEVEVWGSGKPRREFLHVDDMAAASIHVMFLADEVYEKSVPQECSHINVGTGVDISIADVAAMVKDVVGFSGEIKFNTSMPDGTMEKRLDVSLLSALGWQAEIDFRDGLQHAYDWFVASLPCSAKV